MHFLNKGKINGNAEDVGVYSIVCSECCENLKKKVKHDERRRKSD